MKKIGVILSSLCVLALMISGLPLGQAKAASMIYYVSASAVGSNNGTSWANAYTDLQSAIASAMSGNEIWVAAGTYKPTNSTNRTLSFTLKNGVGIYGGFAGSETLRSQRNFVTNLTTLSGDIGVQAVDTDNAYHVVNGGGTNNSAVLDGFSITGGFDPNADGGAGMYNINSNPKLTNVTFKQNITTGSGGGMYNNHSSPSLTNVTFMQNRAYEFGGGMHNSDGSNPTLIKVTFNANVVMGSSGGSSNGGGMSNVQSNPNLKNVTFSNNQADGAGGGIYNAEGNLTWMDVTFIGNKARGGAGMNSTGGKLILTNMTFKSNVASSGGGGGISAGGGSLTLTNVTFTSNSASNGGGGVVMGSYGDLTLTNVTFTGNSTGSRGGALYNSGRQKTMLDHVIFNSNSAGTNGGAIFGDESVMTLVNVVFNNNTAGANGGAISSFLTNDVIKNGVFSNNSALNGGAIYNHSGSPSITNVTFSDNSASKNGGGIYNIRLATPVLRNVTFSNNKALSRSGAMYNEETSRPVIHNSIFWGDSEAFLNVGSSADIYDSLIQGGCPAKATCYRVINSNPILGPLSENGGFTKTIPLGLGSPAIDAGNGNTCAIIDQRGVARPQGPACDMGAYERQQSALILRSQAQNDGWISGMTVGGRVIGSMDAVNPFFYVGDGATNYQYRAILSFDTTSLILPAGLLMTIPTGVALKVKLQSIVGANPYNSLGNLLIDVRKVSFGDSAALQLTDFNAAADANIIGGIPNMPGTPVGGFYTKTWLKNMLPYLNKSGLTQFRLRFATNNNNNSVADDLKFYSGNADVADRPQLIIYYYVP